MKTIKLKLDEAMAERLAKTAAMIGYSVRGIRGPHHLEGAGQARSGAGRIRGGAEEEAAGAGLHGLGSSSHGQ